MTMAGSSTLDMRREKIYLETSKAVMHILGSPSESGHASERASGWPGVGTKMLWGLEVKWYGIPHSNRVVYWSIFPK
jgi:hypothetical protein